MLRTWGGRKHCAYEDLTEVLLIARVEEVRIDRTHCEIWQDADYRGLLAYLRCLPQFQE